MRVSTGSRGSTSGVKGGEGRVESEGGAVGLWVCRLEGTWGVWGAGGCVLSGERPVEASAEERVGLSWGWPMVCWVGFVGCVVVVVCRLVLWVCVVFRGEGVVVRNSVSGLEMCCEFRREMWMSSCCGRAKSQEINSCTLLVAQLTCARRMFSTHRSDIMLMTFDAAALALVEKDACAYTPNRYQHQLSYISEYCSIDSRNDHAVSPARKS